MAGGRQSGFEWRRKRRGLNRFLERVEDLPVNVLSRGRPLTDSAKRKLHDEGIPGRALILDGPGAHEVSGVGENLGRFHAKVELPGREPYEVTLMQSFQGGYEWAGLQVGALVECRVDRDNDKRVLLLAPEPDEGKVTVVDSAEILAKGRRATGVVAESAAVDITAPGIDDPFYRLRVELSADDEPASWTVEIVQRVPRGNEPSVAVGRELAVAYLAVDDGATACVDFTA